MPFETELQTFQKLLPSLLSQEGKEGKFIVILGTEMLGTYDTQADALVAGYNKYGVDTQFFVQKITPVQTIAFLTRFMTPCQT
jgi:hypothetical protein